MFCIKLMLIILLNETFAYVTQSDIETIILPAWKPTGKKKILLTLKTFGKQIELKLYRNDQTASLAYKTWKYDAKDKTKLSHLKTSDFCFYHHNDHISSAIINFCQDNGWVGHIFLEDEILEIRSLQSDFASLILTDNSCIKKGTNISFGKLHRIRRSVQLFANPNIHNMNFNNFKQKRQVEDTQKKLTIELAVFLDEAAYHRFMPILDEDEQKLRNMILAYVNNIEAVFHHPSFGVPIDISLVYFEFMDKQPSNLPLTNHKETLFDTFCDYAYARRPLDDNELLHWDIALYLTGLNIYKLDKNQEKDYSVAGASVSDSVCVMSRNDSCAVVEFGVDGDIMSGFASSLAAAHEIGHTLGHKHDSYLCSNLPFDYIMSTYRNKRGQLTWSECNRNVSENLWNKKQCLRDRTRPVNVTHFAKNHSIYNNLPGREWNAKAQCEIYFRNKDANVVSLVDICQILQCETSTQINFTGPALEGTRCAHEKECRSGKCLPIHKPPYIFSNYYDLYLYKDNWSEWEADSCKSSCLKKSKGAVIKRRFCTHGGNKTAHCKGLYYDVDLCDDSLLCANKSRLKISDYIKKRCNNFILEVNLSKDYQAQEQSRSPYMKKKPWIACTVFCTFIHNDGYLFDLELSTFGSNPFLPDGTRCHHRHGQDYYCRQHYCLPENYSFNSREVM